MSIVNHWTNCNAN